MAEFWKTREFKYLDKIWNNKLELNGFLDAEVSIRGDRVLKQRATNSYRQASELERDTRLDYYRTLGHMANITAFPSKIESLVMNRHAEGHTIKEIVEELGHKGVSRNRLTIRYIIRRWQMKWGIKIWSLKQMKLKKMDIK